MSHLWGEDEELARMAETYHALATCEHVSPGEAARRLDHHPDAIRRRLRNGDVPDEAYVLVNEGGRTSYALRWEVFEEWWPNRPDGRADESNYPHRQSS